MHIARRLTAFFALLAALIGVPADACTGDALAELLTAHARAVGGAETVAGLQALRIVVEIEEPGFVAHGHYLADRDGHMRIDVWIDGARVFSEGLADGTGWQLAGGETVPAATTSEAAWALRRGVLDNLYGLHELPSRGVTLERQPGARIDGVDHDVIDATFPDGFRMRYYLDADTHLVVRRRSEHALHPDLDPPRRSFEQLAGDYREVDGLLRSFSGERRDMATGERAQRTRVLLFEANPALDEASWRPTAFGVIPEGLVVSGIGEP